MKDLETKVKTMDKARKGEWVKIIRCLAGRGLKGRIYSLINREKPVYIVNRQLGHGPFILRQGNGITISIGYGMARKILVEEYREEQNKQEDKNNNY
jgi:Fe2+ transport system protein FeoA